MNLPIMKTILLVAFSFTLISVKAQQPFIGISEKTIRDSFEFRYTDWTSMGDNNPGKPTVMLGYLNKNNPDGFYQIVYFFSKSSYCNMTSFIYPNSKMLDVISMLNKTCAKAGNLRWISKEQGLVYTLSPESPEEKNKKDAFWLNVTSSDSW